MPGSEIQVLANCLPWVVLLKQSHVGRAEHVPQESVCLMAVGAPCCEKLWEEASVKTDSSAWP